MAESAAGRIAALEARVAELEGELDRRRIAAERQLRGIADALPVMISYLDAGRRFRFANRAYEEWFGRPVADIVGRPIEELLSADAYAERRPFVERALAGERVRYEAVFPHASGPRRALMDHIPHVEDGRVLGFYALVQDVTEQWRALQLATESERRFRRIADTIPAPIWVTAPDRTREFANLAYADFVGRPYEEALRFDWRTILHPDDHDRILAESLAGEASGARFTLEARYRRADGEWRWLRSVSQPRYDAAGVPEGFIGVAEDVTEAHRAAEVAAAHAADLSQRLERLWDLSRDPITICDRDGIWRKASPAWTAILGWSIDRLVGRTSEWLLHPEDVGSAQAARARTREGEVIRNLVVRMRGADGGYRWFNWTAVPEGDRLYCTARDVTAEREQAAALLLAEESLRQSQKMEALGQLTGGVAHDFNNLLTPILGALDLVARRLPEGDRTRRMADAALQSAERAKTLVQRLLAFARRQPLDPQPLAPAALVEGMRELIRSTLPPTIEVEVNVEPGLPAALGDANQLELALLNLAVNARDAMPDGGRLSIEVVGRTVKRAEGDLLPGRYVSLIVTDTGSGMDAETLRRATEPFFSTKAQGAGTGLGLSMVHGLAGQLGGGLLIDSAAGQGTRIELLLPACDHAPAPASRTGADGRARPARLRLLLVDDDPLVRAATAAMLAEMTHEVVDCASGAEALERVEAGLGFDLLVCDQVMPQMSGSQLVAALRERRADLRVLLISGYPQGDDRSCGGIERLAKPFTADQLARALLAAQRSRATADA